MKLARPDIFHPRIVLAGDHPSSSDDDADALIGALRTRGLSARRLSWRDPETLRADLVVLCGIGERVARHTGFLSWTREVPHLLDPPAAVAWNADRHYLRELHDAGIPTAAHAAGERTALVFLGGEQSHAFGYPGVEAGVEADFALWDVGRAALQAAAERCGVEVGALLYARADVVGEPGDVRLTGLDLIGPELGWQRLAPVERADAQRRFALAVEAALARLGLGPLSHRRP